MFYTYVLQSTIDKTTYIGYTEDLRKRLVEHNSGKTKSIRSKIPYQLVYYEAYVSGTLARKREHQLKTNSGEKEKLYRRIFE